MNKCIRCFIGDFYLVLMLLFLYFPIFTMIVLSFNESKSRTCWGGFTLRRYGELLSNATIMRAFYNTLLIAFLSAPTATVLGTAAVIGLHAMKRTDRNPMTDLDNISMLDVDTVTGISPMLAFIAFRFTFSFHTALISHITFNVLYVPLSVLPKLKQTNRSAYEAAMDPGVTLCQASFYIVFPGIVPGVPSGFLFVFTTSPDDFIITHLTKGAGIDILSTLIYSQVRRGIVPSMYALSAVIFAAVLLLLLVVNFTPSARSSRQAQGGFTMTRRSILARALSATVLAALGLVLGGCGQKSAKDDNMLYVYNWGEYVGENVVREFGKETGIKVVYDTFKISEEMLPIIEAGVVQYDAVCPFDYIIQKMIQKDLIQSIDFDKVPNYRNIDPKYLERSKGFDPESKYSAPYCWSTVGVLYNTSMVPESETPTSWADLWNLKYQNNILMQDSARDAFMVGEKLLGYDINTTDRTQLEAVKDKLTAQKLFVQAYVTDQVRDKMTDGEAALVVIYSGEMLYVQKEVKAFGVNFDLKYVIPKEGSNVWTDSRVIPKNVRYKENAEKWIDFLYRADITKENLEYIIYPTPNKAALELPLPELQNNKALLPDDADLAKCEVFQYLGEDSDALYDELWREVKAQ